MVAKGKNETACRNLFPSVVKCVVSKHPEVKKLVYAYLVRFAESEPDLSLLSVSSFQRSLKDPNPLIRGSSLRVLSSIRVPVIAPLILAAIKESSHDMSPYVRKTAALSIPKLTQLDPDLKEDAVALIEVLLKDKTSHVLGSVIASFTQVCPDRLDLLHPHYRKFVSLLPDFDEWGQVLLIQVLTRYARTQFLDPFRSLEKKKTPVEAAAASDKSDEEDDVRLEEETSDEMEIDLDLRMLLKNCRPLLQSRNSAVVFSVLQLHLSLFLPCPASRLTDRAAAEQVLTQWMTPCIKPLVRIIGAAASQKEIQNLVLSSVVSLTARYELTKSFEPFLKSFFVKGRDSIHVKLLKLQVLTNLSTSSNIALILREFQAYVNTYSSDGPESESSLFVSSVITAIGDVATRIKEVAEVCLKGLIALLSHRSNESIVAQAVIVIRTQIMNREREAQMIKNGFLESSDSTHSTEHEMDSSEVTSLIIKQLVNSKLMDSDPADGVKDKRGVSAWSIARATILWILAEFCSKNRNAYRMAPDVLRKFSKSFTSESNLVKLQVINLTAKMSLASSPKFLLPFLNEGEEKDSLFEANRFHLLASYIFQLAKYDLSYDIRDRSRFLKSLIAQSEGDRFENVRSVLFQRQRPPSEAIGDLESGDQKKTYRRKKKIYGSKYRVGTLAHFLNQTTPGYEELPDFPEVQPDPSVRVPPPVETLPVKDAKDLYVRTSDPDFRSKKVAFYSDDDSGEDDDEEENDDDEDGEESDSQESGEDEEEEQEGDSGDDSSEEEDSQESGSEGVDDSEEEEDEAEESSEETGQERLTSDSKAKMPDLSKNQVLLSEFS